MCRVLMHICCFCVTIDGKIPPGVLLHPGAGGVPGGLPGLPPGFPGSALPGMHPGLGGIPTSAASLLAGLPPSSSAASALMAAHMGVRMPAPPGLPNPQDLLKKEEEERERANSSKPRIATPGPLSDERNVSSSQQPLCLTKVERI